MLRLNLARASQIALLLLITGGYALNVHAQTCPFDDGNSSLAVEGLILTRYALGITGAPLVASTNINSIDAPTVEAAITCPSCGLNITGNATLTVADATIISRKLAGFSGSALTDNLNLGSGIRNTPAAVQSFLLSGCGATGGSITSITAGTGLTGGTITTTGTIAADTTFLQRRVATPCAAGSFITSIAADGTPTCATPPSGAGGTVTNVATGPGLTGGPITATGTIAADTAFLQRRVSATCTAGSAITAIAADGTVTCGPPAPTLPASCLSGQLLKLQAGAIVCSAAPQTFTTIDNGPINVGQDPSVAIPVDGRPIISYFDFTSTALRVTKCGDASCSSSNVSTLVDNSGPVGRYTSIAVPPPIVTDGFPVISYFGGSGTSNSAAGTLKVAKCVDAGCVGAATVTVVDSSVASIGLYTSIAIPPSSAPNQFPVISYYEGNTTASNGNLKVAKCINAACTGASIITTIDGVSPALDVGQFSAIVVPADGFPVISYADVTNNALKVAKCSAANCTGAVTLTTLDTSTGGRHTAIALSTDGFPVISYRNTTGGQLKVVKCVNAACTGSAPVVADGAVGVGQFTSITVPSDGRPVISHYGGTLNTLRVVKCGDASCTPAGNIASTVDGAVATNNVGGGTAIAISADGMPFVAYTDVTRAKLKTVKCSNAGCANP